MFRPDNSQLTARYGVNPFQRIEIAVGNTLGAGIDRTNGEYFPSPQGSGLYVERCDFPVRLSFVNRATGVEETITLREGLQVECFFKGFTLTHPLLNANLTLSLITFASDEAVIVNQLATPGSRLPLSARSQTSTAASQVFMIYVPEGVRAINNLAITSGITTLTSTISAQLLDGNNNVLLGPSTIPRNVAGAPVIYNLTNPGYIAIPQLAAGGLSFLAQFQKILLPAACREIQISYAGTGLSLAPAFTGWFE